MNLTAKLITKSGNEVQATVFEKQLEEGVVAVYIDGKAEEGLDSEHGADILFAVDNFEGITALERNTEFWCEPVFADNFSGIPDETQMLVVKHNDGTFTFVLPVVSEKYRCTLYGAKRFLITSSGI